MRRACSAGDEALPVRVLCVNSGSSSLKVALYEDETPIASGAVEGIGLGEGRLTVRDAAARVLRDEPGVFPDASAALHGVLAAAGLPAPDAVAPVLVVTTMLSVTTPRFGYVRGASTS